MTSENDKLLNFCPGCYASSEDGSCGHTVRGNECYNCGSTGTIMIPFWAIKSIRENASWIGRNFYPSEEDKSQDREMKELRSLAPPNPRDKAEQSTENPDEWWVTRPLPNKRLVMVSVLANDKKEAISKACIILPYHPEKEYGKDHERA